MDPIRGYTPNLCMQPQLDLLVGTSVSASSPYVFLLDQSSCADAHFVGQRSWKLVQQYYGSEGVFPGYRSMVVAGHREASSSSSRVEAVSSAEGAGEQEQRKAPTSGPRSCGAPEVPVVPAYSPSGHQSSSSSRVEAVSRSAEGAGGHGKGQMGETPS